MRRPGGPVGHARGTIGWQADQQDRSVAAMAVRYRRIYENALRRARDGGAGDGTSAPQDDPIGAQAPGAPF